MVISSPSTLYHSQCQRRTPTNLSSTEGEWHSYLTCIMGRNWTPDLTITDVNGCISKRRLGVTGASDSILDYVRYKLIDWLIVGTNNQCIWLQKTSISGRIAATVSLLYVTGCMVCHWFAATMWAGLISRERLDLETPNFTDIRTDLLDSHTGNNVTCCFQSAAKCNWIIHERALSLSAEICKLIGPSLPPPSNILHIQQWSVQSNARDTF